MMWTLLEEFKDIIKDRVIQKYEASGDNIKLRMQLFLKDGSVLCVRETVISGEKRKYSYHWQDKHNTMIRRWDNAPDWEVETFPHHLHVGDNVIPSYTRTLEKVLETIRKEIQ